MKKRSKRKKKKEKRKKFSVEEISQKAKTYYFLFNSRKLIQFLLTAPLLHLGSYA